MESFNGSVVDRDSAMLEEAPQSSPCTEPIAEA